MVQVRQSRSTLPRHTHIYLHPAEMIVVTLDNRQGCFKAGKTVLVGSNVLAVTFSQMFIIYVSIQPSLQVKYYLKNGSYISMEEMLYIYPPILHSIVSINRDLFYFNRIDHAEYSAWNWQSSNSKCMTKYNKYNIL